MSPSMTEYQIERLGHQGDGIAAGPVFVPGALPGETVTGALDGDVLRDMRIVTPSDDRVRPPCSHAKSCGGCQLQHAADNFVAEWKLGVVKQALAAQGIAADLEGPIVSPAQSRRRASFSARRTKKGALAGFHMKASDTVISVPNCQLVHPDLVAALPMVEALAVLGASRKGELSVLVTKTETGLDVSVRGGKDLDAELQLSPCRNGARTQSGADCLGGGRGPTTPRTRSDLGKRAGNASTGGISSSNT